MSFSHAETHDPAIELADAGTALFTLTAQSVQMIEMLRDHMAQSATVPGVGLMSLDDYLDWTQRTLENWMTFQASCSRGMSSCFDLVMEPWLHPPTQRETETGPHSNGQA
jgi:hypothetical protein